MPARFLCAALGAIALASAPALSAQGPDPARLTPGRVRASVSTLGSQDGRPRQRPAPKGERDSVTIGGRTIPAGTAADGPIVTAGGDIDVFGTVRGSAIAIAGDVVVHPGGRVTGDAIAVFGAVRRSDGVVDGAARSLTGVFGASVRSLLQGTSDDRPARSPTSLALAWFLVMLLIGLGVLVFANPYLGGVVDVLGQSFWKSFVTGILGELGIVPAILLVVVGLTITVLGILLVPFAVVAAILAIAGLATLGFVAVARLTGEGIRNRGDLGAKGSALRGLLIGMSLYMGLWVVATLLTPVPVLGIAVRLLAVMVTYVAVTAGFGAAILSRGGTRRDAGIVPAPAPAPALEAAWQTPTPVAGIVAAARRTHAQRTGTQR